MALLAQIEIVHFLTWHRAEPSFVLIAVVWYTLRTDLRRAAFFGFAAGLCEDLLGGAVTAAGTGGAWTISTTLTALLVSSLSQRFFSDSLPVAAAATVAATLFRRWIFWTVMSLEGYPRGYGGVHFREALWEALFNVAAMVVVVLIARFVEARRTA